MDQFKDKIVYCPCDNCTSAFVHYFDVACWFLGLKQLISTALGQKEIFVKSKSGTNLLTISDSDFRSEEVRELISSADIIVTNPPFSLYRDFFAWIVKAEKQFILVANKNCATYKEIFPLIRDNKIWVGVQPMGVDMLFDVPKERAEYLLKNEKEGSKQVVGRLQTALFIFIKEIDTADIK